MMRFKDRYEAGRMLADRINFSHEALVLALPRGGVPVGYEIARVLHAPLDVFLVRKLGYPGQEELAIGAIASGGVRILNEEILRHLPLSHLEIDAITQFEEQELIRRQRAYRGTRLFPVIKGRHVVLVDDGLATGSTMRAALKALRRQAPHTITVAVPVAPKGAESLLPEADEVICLATPEPFHSVSHWYDSFTQVGDQEVQMLLEQTQDDRQPQAA